MPSMTVKCFFSFRSPYAWLAMHRINQLSKATKLPIDFSFFPIYPNEKSTGKFNDPVANPNKLLYLITDITRLANAYGLNIQLPTKLDTDWVKVHAAYLQAHDLGKGFEFILAAFNARFSQGLDLGDDRVLTQLSEKNGLPADLVITAKEKETYQLRLKESFQEAEKEKVFGVPFMIYQGEKFWGNDRFDWLLRRLQKDNGIEVPDLTLNPFSLAFG